MTNDTPFLRFTVPGLPIAKGRPRVTKTGHTFTPQRTLSYEAQVRFAFTSACPGWRPYPRDIPLALDIVACFPLPASTSKKRRLLLGMGNAMPMVQRPDLDNLAKTVLDALNLVCWSDDAQVAEIRARKRRTSGAPVLYVCVSPLSSPSVDALGPSRGALTKDP